MKSFKEMTLDNESSHVSSVVQLIYCSFARNCNTKKIFAESINDILTKSKIFNPLYNITTHY